MWTRKGVSTATSGFFFIILGILYNNYIFVFIGILFLSSLLSVFFNLMDFELEIRRQLEFSKIFQGDNIRVKVIVTNRSLLTGFFEISDSLPKRVTISRGNYSSKVYLKPGESLQLDYIVCGHLRGHFLIGPLVIRQYDNLGFYYKETVVESYSDLSVMPVLEELTRLDLMGNLHKTFHGHTNIKDVGEGTEFYSLRDYLPGDPYRKVNWKAFAKFDKLIINEFEMENTAEIFLILDARLVTGIGTIFQNPLEASVKAAASMTSYFLGKKSKVGLAIYSNSLEFIHPAQGERQMSRILDMLMDARAMGSRSLETVLKVVIPQLKPRMPIYVLSPAEFDDQFVPVMEELVAMGFSVTLVSPSFPEVENSIWRLKGINYDLAKMKRDTLLSELRYAGVVVVDWDPGTPLTNAFAEVIT